MVAQDGWTPAAGVSQLDVWHYLVTIDIHRSLDSLDVTHTYDSRWCFIRLCPFYFWQPPFVSPGSFGKTHFLRMLARGMVCGRRAGPWLRLPAFMWSDRLCGSDFFSGWIAKSEGKLFQSTLLPTIGPPFPSSFRCKYFIHLYVCWWMWFDDFEDGNPQKKKAHCFFDARFLGAWCQIAAFATRLAWNWVRIVRSHAIRVWFSVAAHLDLFQTIWTETLVSITHHHVLNSEMTPMLSLVMCRPYLCFTFVSSEAAL